MPPKKPKKLEVSNASILRRRFNRRNFGQTPTVVIVEEENPVDENTMFASRHEKFKYPQPKKKQAEKKVFPTFPTSPGVSGVEISSDDEVFQEPPERNNEDDEEIRRLNQMYDSLDNISLPIFNKDGLRVKFDKNRKVIGIHENQPPEKWRPMAREEDVGNFLPIKKLRNKKKKDEEKKVKEKKTLAPAPIPARNETIYEKICRTIRENVTKAAEKAVAISTVQPSFRVFGTPTRLKIMGGGSAIEKKKKEIDDRISIFSYTPIRGNKMNHAARFSTISGFSPQIQNASTPIDKQAKERLTQQKIPVFDLSDDFLTEKEEKSVKEQEEPLEETELDTALEKTKVQEKTALLQSTLHNSSLHIYNDQFEEIIKIPSETQQETMQNGTFRKAETSMTEILVDSEAEHIEQEEMNYSKKRQRTISPVTIQVPDTESTATEPEEKENKEQGKRATLQPQQQQILRESRLSVMTTASSRRESLNSLMEDMSIDMQSLDTLENETGATSRVIESRLQTGMTIRQEDDEVLPFYLQNGSFIDMPSYFTQLLHVCGQKEVKAWGSLPKGVFDGRRVKKIGEGSYGEVFSTVWEGQSVAIKVVPFEPDSENRQYFGEYHSEEMQEAALIVPEVVVMKELSAMNDMFAYNSTPNFIKMISAIIVKGQYPKGLLKAWDHYDKFVKGSENTRPNVYASNNQNFIILVSENGGIALEDFRLQSENELRSILLQLTLSMKAAEETLEFEHRDLHLGNVLIDRSGVEKLSYRVNGHDVTMNAHGVKLSIIDFTLGRIKKGPTFVYMDLEKDPGIFTGEGDPQFEVYRKMRALCGRNWHTFNRKTNVMWIEFIANQLIDTEICPPGVISDDRKQELRKIFTRLGEYDSCKDSFIDPEFFTLFYEGLFDEINSVAQSP